MNSLIQTIELLEPGHFGKRYESLQRLSTKVSELGFFPLSISGKDLNCYWIRIQAAEQGKTLSITWELYDDLVYNTSLLESLKKTAKYHV
jgi:hypothetical protein